MKVENFAAAHRLQATFDEIDNLLETELDATVEALVQKAPDFVAEYRMARRIIDYAATHAGAGQTPPPAAPSAPPAK